MADLKDKLRGRRMGSKDLLAEAQKPLMRNPMMPLAVMGRSPQSRARAVERMKGITDRGQRMEEAREEMEAKYMATRIRFPKIKR